MPHAPKKGFLNLVAFRDLLLPDLDPDPYIIQRNITEPNLTQHNLTLPNLPDLQTITKEPSYLLSATYKPTHNNLQRDSAMVVMFSHFGDVDKCHIIKYIRTFHHDL